MRDYTSVGFTTYDCLGWPVQDIPAGGGTTLIDDLTIAVSGAAGTAAIAAAKLGLSTSAVGGVGQDLMGDWVLEQMNGYGIETADLMRCVDVPTSSSIVLTRDDGSRPALHRKGATSAFVVPPARYDEITDARVFHLGGVGLMDAMDGARNAELMAYAQSRGCVTTVDVFAGSQADLPAVEAVLPHTDYFIPSIEEARALSGMVALDDIARFFLSRGARCCVFTMGEEGAYYHHADGTVFSVPAFDIGVRCTCGCGDVFNAGFAVGLVHGMTARETIRFAQACSALNATGLGSQAGITDFDGVQRFIAETPVKAVGASSPSEPMQQARACDTV